MPENSLPPTDADIEADARRIFDAVMELRDEIVDLLSDEPDAWRISLLALEEVLCLILITVPQAEWRASLSDRTSEVITRLQESVNIWALKQERNRSGRA
jgi:hypothetical protein